MFKTFYKQIKQTVEPLRQIAKDSIHLVKMSTKPDKKEFWKIAIATAIRFAITQLDQTSKARQKLDFKIREISGSYFICQIWLKTEIMWIYLKLCWKNSWNHIKWTCFWWFLVIWNHCVSMIHRIFRQTRPHSYQRHCRAVDFFIVIPFFVSFFSSSKNDTITFYYVYEFYEFAASLILLSETKK